MNEKEIYRIKENRIHLKNYFRKFLPHRCNGIWETEYEIDYVGKNIKQKFVKQKSKSNKKNFHIDKVKKQFIAITTEINVVMREDSNIHIFQNGKTGIALLLIATYCSEEKEEIIIDETCIEKFQKNRNNLATEKETTLHFGSMGYVYGVGLVAHYSLNNNLSFGTYSNPMKKKKTIINDEKYMMDIVTKCMLNAMFSLQRKIPKVHEVFFSISNFINQKLVNHPSNLEKSVSKCDIPINLSCQFNVNATTKYSHTERDSSYTIIHVPRQNQVNDKFIFYFKISSNEELRIQLEPNTTISYSSYLLTHSQRKNEDFDSGENCFVNISSYFSKRLFDNISTSLNRIEIENK